MTTIELLTLHRELLSRLREFGIRMDDCAYIDLYHEYMAMRAKGEKTTYIVAMLSVRYQVSERKVYTLIKRLGNNCMPRTV